MGDQPSQGLYLHREQHKHRINAHNTDIHALSGSRTHDPSVRASEDSSCLSPCGQFDRQHKCTNAQIFFTAEHKMQSVVHPVLNRNYKIALTLKY
jgi:hypothetical protein